MRIGFVSRSDVGAFLKSYEGERADAFVFGFNGTGQVSYEKELDGETNRFEEAAMLSSKYKCVVVSGCVTDTRGHKRRSAVVAENGRLIGVTDLTRVIDGDTGGGAFLRVYETKIGRIGVAVGDDLRFFEVFRALSDCGAEYIVCPVERIREIETVLARAYAYSCGTPIALCAEGYAVVAGTDGKLVFASPTSPAFAQMEVLKEYHLVEIRRRFTR